MLLNKFFSLKQSVVEVTPENYSFSVLLNPEYPVYKGHFPEMPVVPGVCTLQMIKECAEIITGLKLQYTSILNCKFTAMICPSFTPELNIVLSITNQEDGYLLKATVKKESQTFLSLKAELKKDENNEKSGN